MNKVCALTLILFLTVSSIIMVESVSAESIPKPSVPQFTVTLVDTSYDVDPTSTINPYTGETTVNEGRRVESRAIEIRIKNEPFTPFEIQEGTAKWTVGYFYQIRWKGHFEKDWHELFLISDGLLGRNSGSETIFAPEGDYSATDGLSMKIQGMYGTFPPKSQLDFQVKAMIGYVHRVESAIPGGGWIFTGEESDWSVTQTLIIPETSASGSPSPGVPELPVLAILPLFVVVPLIATVILRKKKRR